MAALHPYTTRNRRRSRPPSYTTLRGTTYCFRRNVYGLRTFAITVAGFLALGSIVAIVALPSTPVDVGPAIPVVSLLIALAWIALYAAWFTSNWVRRAADAYADELLKHALEART